MSSAQIDYTDLGFNQRSIDFCNQERDDENYVNAHIDAFKDDLSAQLGIVPSEDLVDAYRIFMEISSTISISTNLQQSINPSDLIFYHPIDVIQLLRPDILVNDESVDIPYNELLSAEGIKRKQKNGAAIQMEMQINHSRTVKPLRFNPPPSNSYQNT